MNRRAIVLVVAPFLLSGTLSISRGAEDAGSEVAQAGSGITLPVLVKPASPPYPDELKQAGREGQVALQVEVRKNGTVGEVHVVASDDPAFTEPAVATAKKWLYRPATQNGTPITFYENAVLKFNDPSAPRRSAAPRIDPCLGEGGELAETVDERPRIVAQHAVVLPGKLKTGGGYVTVEFEICQDGRVRSTRVVETSDQALVEPAVATARTWIFAPARRNGHPVPARLVATVTIDPTR